MKKINKKFDNLKFGDVVLTNLDGGRIGERDKIVGVVTRISKDEIMLNYKYDWNGFSCGHDLGVYSNKEEKIYQWRIRKPEKSQLKLDEDVLLKKVGEDKKFAEKVKLIRYLREQRRSPHPFLNSVSGIKIEEERDGWSLVVIRSKYQNGQENQRIKKVIGFKDLKEFKTILKRLDCIARSAQKVKSDA